MLEPRLHVEGALAVLEAALPPEPVCWRHGLRFAAYLCCECNRWLCRECATLHECERE